MTDYIIAHTDPVNFALLGTEMHAALPALITGISSVIGVSITVHFINEPTVQQQQDAQAVLTAHDPDAQTEQQAQLSALADMIATFTVSAGAITYFNALQTELRNVSENNSVDIAAVFPVMRDLLNNNPALYQRYLNLLRITTGINQATFENTPTAAQQRNAFAVAVDFANTGMIQMIAGVMFG